MTELPGDLLELGDQLVDRLVGLYASDMERQFAQHIIDMAMQAAYARGREAGCSAKKPSP